MTTSTGSDLREYIRGADDSAYVASAAAETPRSRIVDLYGPLGEARRRAPVHPQKQAELLGQEDYRKEEAFKAAFSCALQFRTLPAGAHRRTAVLEILAGHHRPGLGPQHHRHGR